jgi:hypothetical protein
LPQFVKFRDGVADGLAAGAAFRDEPGHGLVMLGDDDFLAAGDPLQQLPEAGFGIKCGDNKHK